MNRMLSEVDSPTLTEWQAYEEHAGPLDRTWDQEVAAQTHELIQHLINVVIQTNSEKKQNLKVIPVGRPWPESEKDKVPEQTEEEIAADKADFYRTLAERNRRRGISDESIQEDIRNAGGSALVR